MTAADLGTGQVGFAPDVRRAVQRIGAQRPATALTRLDPAAEVCRQTATKVNRSELLTARRSDLLGSRQKRGEKSKSNGSDEDEEDETETRCTEPNQEDGIARKRTSMIVPKPVDREPCREQNQGRNQGLDRSNVQKPEGAENSKS